MSAAAGTVVALDAGQTGTKVRVERAGLAPHEMLLPGVLTHGPLLPQLAGFVRLVHTEIGVPVETVAVGASGLTSSEADAADLLRHLDGTGASSVLLTHDSVTSFLGSLGDAQGAVIAAGTGVVTLGVGSKRVARVDGWGNIMGDAGSAYWIGRAALEEAMRAYDGRAADTALLDVLRARWPEPADAYVSLQSAPDRVRIVASFAEAVTNLASTDAAAATICRRAAHELAQSVVASLRRVAEPDDSVAPQVSALGGVFRSEHIRTAFGRELHEAWPGIVLTPARGSGLDGAALMPSLAPSHPLRALISAASIS